MPKRRRKDKSVPHDHRNSQALDIGAVEGEETVSERHEVSTHTLAEDVMEEEGEEELNTEEGREEEEYSEGGVAEGAGGDEDAGREGSKKVRIAGLYQPPTHDELRTLKETQNLFQSNLMRLQITELLGEVRPSPCSKLDELLTNLRTTLMNLPPTTPVNLCEAVQDLPSKVHYPLHLDPSSVKGKFSFRPPVAVKVVGSYLLKTAIKPDLNVDLALQIPEECLQAKDHLNYRYLHKRALYLCHVAAHLNRKKRRCGLKRAEFCLSHSGPLKPLLLLTPEEDPHSSYSIRLHTTIPEAPFKPVKLVPDRNNLRPHALQQLPPDLRPVGNPSDEESSSTENLHPTPYYNSLVVSDMGGMERHLAEVYAAQQECPAMVDAVMLFRVWARQRGLAQGYGGFTGFHFSMLLVLLLTQRKITALMSSYQILRVALQTIASSDWSAAGISMATVVPSHFPLSSFHLHHSVVFLDSTGLLNLLCHLSLSRYAWLRHEAATSLACLDNPATDGFKALLMTALHFEMKFDLLIHVSAEDVIRCFLAKETTERESLLLDRGSWPLPLIMERVFPILVKGLEKRVNLIALRPFNHTDWVLSKQPVLPCDSHVTLGVSLDPDHAFSVLDMGPAADSKQAAEFRAFWGDRAELRRFQDGSINEAVVWKGGTVGERRGVVTQVVTHLLNRHVGIPAQGVVSTSGVLHPLISLPHYSHSHHSDDDTTQSSAILATGEEECKVIEDTFTEFSKQLRGLKGLPLAITSVQGASSEFRHSSVFPAMPWSGKTPRKFLAKPSTANQPNCLYPSCDSATPPFVPAMEVVLQLEGSGKWPSELSAIAHIKTAFYIFLSQALADQCKLLCSPTMHYLDVLKSGYVYRLRIYHHRELAILRDALSAAKPHEATELKKTLSHMERKLVDRPLLTSILHGLSQQFSALAPGARLCKRWVSAHMLSNHITDEAVELLAAQLFLRPDPFTPPNSPECVLLRFLFLFSTHDWEAEPLVVNLNNELSVTDIADNNSRFTSQRSQLPPCFIATPLHRDSSPFTSPSPSLPVLYRACLLAREALSLLSTQLTSADLVTTHIKQVFRTPLTGYNVLIHLHKKHLPLVAQGVDSAMEGVSGYTRQSSRGHPTHFPITDFNPAEKYLTDLENAFSEFCLFFYDKYGGRYIAVVWKPTAFVPQPFKVVKAFCKTQAAVKKNSKKKSEELFVPDVKAILADFEVMGDGLVSSVEVLSDPPLGNI